MLASRIAVDIAAWLREIGLDQYEQAFLDNAIDADVLPTLTADDLKDIGVTAVGHRRKLLNAIATLREPERSTGGESVSPAARGAGGRAEAERRQLTVVFCDLVGSTELSARLDPEDLRAVVGAYHGCASAVVERFEGHVAQYLGDGVLAYFGWPRAHEDDAERAVRAALELVEGVARLDVDPEVGLQARVGIATGIAVVGELIGEEASREEIAVGDVPNLAARLQALAEPGSVVISQATRRLVSGLFELDDLGPQRLKGLAEPLSAWRVSCERWAEGRFEAHQTMGLTPLVDREEEILLLLRRWRHARDGEGQLVLLSGEPGIGKSRLVREFGGRLEGEPHFRRVYQCSPYHTTSPLHPLIEQLQHAAGFERADPPEAKLDKLETLLVRGTDRMDDEVPLVAAILGVPVGERYPLPQLTPQRRKQRTLEVLVDQLDRLAAEQPVLMIFEDVHWIDPTTHEFLCLAIDRIQRLRVLLLITFRPEFTPPWISQPHVSVLPLTRLGRRDGAAMVDQIAGAKALPTEVAVQIVAKTDGVPLFVEELTKTVLELGLLKDSGDRYELSGPLPPLAIPATLHDSLLARLDRLAPVKEVAQIGAAIGREFSHDLLAAVCPLPEQRLNDALEQLVSSELLFRRGRPPNATYTFKHSLVQDTAYQALLKSKRQQLHSQIAKALEERLPEQALNQPEVLAYHFTEGGLTRQAVGYWLQAGERAIRHSAHIEAIAHLSRGLDLVSHLPAASERAGCELDLLVTLGPALISAKGQSAPEVEANYAKARALCVEVGDRARLFTALRGLYIFHLVRGQLGTAIEVGQQLLELAEMSGDSGDVVEAHRALCTTWMYDGQLSRALSEGQRGLALYDPSAHGAHAYRYGLDPGVALSAYTAWTSWFLGFPTAALEGAEDACTRALASEHPYTLAQALVFACYVHQARGDPRRTIQRADSALIVAREQGFPVWAALVTTLRGWCLAALEKGSGGLEQLRSGLAAYRSTGAKIAETYLLTLLAEVEAGLGHTGRALATIDQALRVVASTGVRCWEPELHRLHGQLLLRHNRVAERAAEDSFHKAIALARTQEAKSWELRAATSLARLWAEQGKRAQARDLLAPVYGWFTEGFDTADLKAATALLGELA